MSEIESPRDLAVRVVPGFLGATEVRGLLVDAIRERDAAFEGRIVQLERERDEARAERDAERQAKWKSLVDLSTEIRDIVNEKVAAIPALYMKLREQDGDIERLKDRAEAAEARLFLQVAKREAKDE